MTLGIQPSTAWVNALQNHTRLMQHHRCFHIIFPLSRSKTLWPNQISKFLPCPLFLNEPSPLRTEIWGNVFEISAYEMGQAFATLKCHQMTLMVFTLWLDISNMVSSTVISFPGSPVIITMPIAIYLMKIEKHGRSQFVHNFMTSIKPSYYKEHCFVTTRYH